MLDVLSVLMQWQSFRGEDSLHLSYRATKTEIIKVLRSSIDELSPHEADRIVTFLTLQPDEVRRLLGKPEDEGDVPTWEHNKRGSRYTIRPLVPMDQDLLAWGAASAERARSIWVGNVTSGYLPADFDWPSVQSAVRAIKKGLEKQLEQQACEICERHTPFVVPGIDFKRRFPKENFDDVGDFDVLAYWPAQNRWLAGECKYNQPPFCLKDARRLRDRIFGIAPDHGQFAKIERRRAFLAANLDRLRGLLKWPIPNQPIASVTELYISRDIYWWLRFPPYEVPAQFVRIDGLNAWLTENGF